MVRTTLIVSDDSWNYLLGLKARFGLNDMNQLFEALPEYIRSLEKKSKQKKHDK